MESTIISDNIQVLKNNTYLSSVDELEEKDINAILNNQAKLTDRKYNMLMHYYLGEHKILDLKDDPNSTENNKIVDNIPAELVDTFNGFFIGVAPKIVLDNDHENDLLQGWNNSNSFMDKLNELSKLTDIYGRAYAFVYQNDAAETRATYTDPTDSVLIYDNSVDRKPICFIRYWYDSTKQAHANIYYAKYTAYYSGTKLTDRQEINVYGLVPAVEFYANEERKGLYEREISTIDALDDLASQKQNNIDYFANAYMYIIGGKINEKDAIRMRQQRLINATSANAMNAKIGFLERPNADGMEEHQRSNLLEMIHNNTGIPNMNDEHFAGNSSGVAIKYKFQAMEDKAATKESKFKYALRNFYRIIFAKNTKLAINSEAWEDLKFYFKRNLPANLTDEADIVNKLQGIVSDETLLTILSVVSDPKEELKQRKQEQDEKLQNAMNLSKPDALVDDGENNG